MPTTARGLRARRSPTARRVFAYFESFGLYAYDMNGTLMWKKDLGDKRMRNQFGEGSTPALHGNTLVVVWDHLNGDGSFVVALDKRDGRSCGASPREEIDTWATPLVLDVERPPAGHRAGDAAHPQLRPRHRRGRLGVGWLDDESDSIAGVRRRPGVPDERVPGQRSQGHSGRRRERQSSTARRTSSGRSIATRRTCRRRSSSTAMLYFLKTNSGILSAFDAKTGKPHYQNQRLDGVPNVFASPVAARGRIYIPGREGTTIVIRSGPTYRGAGEEYAGRRVRRVAGDGRWRDLPAGPQVFILHRR